MSKERPSFRSICYVPLDGTHGEQQTPAIKDALQTL
jgi:hypothetical protein